MRLDLFLKTSTLIKRRTVAKMACDFGKILVNGKTCKSSYKVKKDDIIVIMTKHPPIKARVVDISKKTNKQDAKKMFELI